MSRTRAVVWGKKIKSNKIKCSNVCIVPEEGSVVFISHLGKLHFTPVTTVTGFAGAFFFTFAFILPFLAHYVQQLTTYTTFTLQMAQIYV